MAEAGVPVVMHCGGRCHGWERLELGDEWLRAVCHDNGARLFGL